QRLLGEGDEPDAAFRSFLSLSLLAGLATTAVAIPLGIATLPLTPVEVTLIVGTEILTVAVVFLSGIAVQASSGFPAAIRVKGAVIPMRLGVLLLLWQFDALTIRNLAAGFGLCFSLYGVYLLKIHLPKHGYRPSLGRPSRLSIRSSFMFSAPMGASKLQTDADKYLLNLFRHNADAGLYGAAYRMVLLGTLPLLALETAAFQRFLPKGDGRPGLHLRRSVRMATLMFVASVAVSGALFLLLPWFDFLFAAEFKEAMDIVPWLLLLIPLISTSGTPLNGLLGLGLPDKRMWVYISAAAVSLVLYFSLIPAFSWEGALIATIVSEVYLSIAGWATLWHYQRRSDAAGTTGGDETPDLAGAASPA
ncbi:MAG: polysaccharide biosynthesis C-terminal domain-containing protein, partial [Actinomycetota bacterium]